MNDERCSMNAERRTPNGRIAVIALMLSVYSLVLTDVAHAAVPHLIRYQGQAVDSKSVPLEGPYSLTFRLYDAETAGTKLWEEIQPNVQLSGGQFSVLLGQVTSLNAMDWSQACWLSVQVNSEPELAPRQRITSVPLAIRAAVAEQLAAPVTTSTITDDDHRLIPKGAIILWSDVSCPTGYTRMTGLDGRFLVAGPAFNRAAGGSDTKDISHTHGAGSYAGPSHSHGGVTGAGPHNQNFLGGGSAASTDYHTHSISTDGTGAVTGTSAIGGSAALDIRPAFATVLLCEKN